MNICIAGGSGAIGRQLVPMLVQQGHKVVAMTRSQEGAVLLDAMGAKPVLGNVFDKERLAVSNAELVARVAKLADRFGRTVATPAEARQILGLRAA